MGFWNNLILNLSPVLSQRWSGSIITTCVAFPWLRYAGWSHIQSLGERQTTWTLSVCHLMATSSYWTEMIFMFSNSYPNHKKIDNLFRQLIESFQLLASTCRFRPTYHSTPARWQLIVLTSVSVSPGLIFNVRIFLPKQTNRCKAVTNHQRQVIVGSPDL